MSRPSAPDLAAIGRLLGEPSRATMLLALLDGRAWTASEFADTARVSRSTASAHRDRLVGAGLIGEVRQGRHRYLRITSPAVAEAIEPLAALSPWTRPDEPTLRATRADQQLREAHTCYRHLAGRLSVAVCDAAHRHGYVDADWQLTATGRTWLDPMNVPITPTPGRAALRPCLDWTERRDHLAGTAADALLAAWLERDWLRPGRVPRSLRLTQTGARQLDPLLGP